MDLACEFHNRCVYIRERHYDTEWILMRKVKDKMKKKNKNIVITFVLIMLLAVSLSGCGKIKFSGTYVNEHDRKEKFKFSGESKVTYYNHGQRIKGTYFGDNDCIVITFGQGDDAHMMVLMVESKKVLYYNMMAFVKKGYIERNWWKWLIAGAAYLIIDAAYRRRTGRNLDEDLEDLGNKFDNLV